MNRPVLVLVGAPGAGKSSIGKRVAEHLQVSFVDTDELIEKSVGMKVSDIFVTLGEAEFRRIEQEVVAGALLSERGVVALGGGAVMNATTRGLLLDQCVVWLLVDVSFAAKRVGLNTSRPLLLGNVRGRLKSLMDDRAPIYESISTYVVDTCGRSIKAVTNDVVELVGGAQDA